MRVHVLRPSSALVNGLHTGQRRYAVRTLSSTLSPPSRSATRGIKSAAAKDNPIPFLNNNARKFNIDGVYKVDSRGLRRQKFALPLGLCLFGVIMYLGFNGKDYEKYVQLWNTEMIEPSEGQGQATLEQTVPDGIEKR